MDFIKVLKHSFRLSSLIYFSLVISACGGGSSSNNMTVNPPSGTDPVWTAGTYADESTFKNICETPRTGSDINGDAFPDLPGSVLYENNWLRSWSNNTYLWYSELPDINPAQESIATDYFDLLVTSELTASGSNKDNFHFFMDSAEYLQLAQSGVSVSYGIDWELTRSTVPRELYIRFIEPGSPADAAGLALTRGVQIILIDGVDVETANTQADIDILNAGLFPSSNGESHTFTLLDVGSSQNREVTIQATEVTSDPVPMVNTLATNTGNVGYILFNDHNFVSEDRLFEAVTQLSNNNINDLILDLRYNGGGFLYIASQLSYMIAGSAATNGKTFEQLRFNDKHTQTDPVTGNTLSPSPFYSSISQYSDNYAQGTALPQLNLNRIFILATDGTCSASEAIINGLRGIDVEVILIGDTTCGKPYGFYATDNCGTTYFTIQFDGINDKSFGGYSDGFSPMNIVGTAGELIPGCSVEDELSIPLGDVLDPLVSAALGYRVNGVCPSPPTQAKSKYQPSFFLDGGKSNDKLELKFPTKLNQKIYLEL